MTISGSVRGSAAINQLCGSQERIECNSFTVDATLCKDLNAVVICSRPRVETVYKPKFRGG